MTEYQNEPAHRQDPAEPNEVDTAVETSDQEVVPEAPVANGAVEVSPADPNVKTDSVFGKDYEVTSDRGYRKVRDEAPTEESDDSNS